MPAVTFDLWHTLVRLPPAAEDQYLERQEAALAEIVRSSPRLARRSDGNLVDPGEAAHLAFASAMHRPGRGMPLAELARDAARRAGRYPRPARWLQAVARYVAALPFEPVDGSIDALRTLRTQGYRTGIVSNLVGETGVSMRGVLRRMEMAQYIESWAFSDELPWAKPAPQIFWSALGPLATAPSDAVHVGDLEADISGARAAGFRGAILFRGGRPYGARYAVQCKVDAASIPPAEYLLENLGDLPGLLRSVFRGGASPPAARSAGRRPPKQRPSRPPDGRRDLPGSRRAADDRGVVDPCPPSLPRGRPVGSGPIDPDGLSIDAARHGAAPEDRALLSMGRR